MSTTTTHTKQPQHEVLHLIEHHDRLWSQLPSLTSSSWTDFPWPVLRTITNPDEITFILVSNYFQSLPEARDDDKSRRSTVDRIKAHLKRWHPDRFESRFLPRVIDGDKENVKRAAGNVVCYLNDLLHEAERQIRAAEVLRRLEHHDRLWTRLLSTLDNELKWSDFPWPIFQTVMNPDEITYISVCDYFLSPLLPEKSKPFKNRLKKHLQRWHPDRLEFRVLPRVIDADKEKVKQAAGNVICYLVYLFKKESQEDGEELEMINPFRHPFRVFCPPDPVAKPFLPNVSTSASQFNAPPSPSSQAPPASDIVPPMSNSRSVPSGTARKEVDEGLQTKAAKIQRLQEAEQERAKKREEALSKLKEEVLRKQDDERKRAEEEGRRRIEEMVKELKEMEKELRKRQGDVLRMEQDARRKMEEAQKVMLEAERQKEEIEMREEEVERYLRQEEEKIVEVARVMQAALGRRGEETRRKAQAVELREDALRQREREARLKEAYLKWKEEDVKRRGENVKRREEAVRNREEEAQQDASGWILNRFFQSGRRNGSCDSGGSLSPPLSDSSNWTLRGSPVVRGGSPVRRGGSSVVRGGSPAVRGGSSVVRRGSPVARRAD